MLIEKIMKADYSSLKNYKWLFFDGENLIVAFNKKAAAKQEQKDRITAEKAAEILKESDIREYTSGPGWLKVRL